jgi:hypothetical protein
VETSLNILPTLENGLFALGQVLRFPVMALLWVCVLAALFMAGRGLVDYVIRQRERRGFDLDQWLQAGPLLGSDAVRQRELPTSVRGLLLDVNFRQLEWRRREGPFDEDSDPGGSRNGSTEMRS